MRLQEPVVSSGNSINREPGMDVNFKGTQSAMLIDKLARLPIRGVFHGLSFLSNEQQ
jgi:hypothetical protein